MIPEHVMRELRYIEVSSAKRIRALRLGAYTSRLRGPGFDFDEHQPYRPGDDVRRIDWNVTARMNAPYVRHTHAERELNMMIALDVSRSMELGTSHYSKKEVMTFVTGSLLFSALSDQINTGFMAFADRVVAFSQPRRTRGAAWTMLEQCWSLSPQPGPTALIPAIRHLVRTLKKTSVVCLVTDFLTDEDVFGSRDLSVLAARHDVIAVIPEDPAEGTLPAGRGYVNVRDLESSREVSLALTRRGRRAFADEARRRRDRLAHAFYRVPMDHVFVPTNGSPVEPLLALFARRIRA
ncbi:MAG TPA: DUF58 domain-containing protein [Vicinamibacterales bacterium]|jgi:uncharacterized protein (DUF58 family)|nr:DUF58 domain-containing protein [Vicinamibacterales bacterium]